MKVIKITEEDEKKLIRLKYFLDSELDEEDNSFIISARIFSDYGIDEIESPYANRKYLDLDEFSFLIQIIENLIKLNENASRDYVDDENSTGSGTLIAKYYPNTKEIEVGIEYYVLKEDSSGEEFTFDELSKIERGQWGHVYKYIKNLGDEEYVKSLQDYYGDYVILSYDGGGDSGALYDECESANGTMGMINDIFEMIGYEIIDINYSGWEDNYGGRGDIIINFKNKTVENNHVYYGEEEEYEVIEIYSLKA